jgi:hypothetical protein
VPYKDGWEDSLTRRKRQANGRVGFIGEHISTGPRISRIIRALPDGLLDGHSLHLSNRVFDGTIGNSTGKSRIAT